MADSETKHRKRTYYMNRTQSRSSTTRPILLAALFTALLLGVVTLLYLLLTGDAPQLTAHYIEQDPPDVDVLLPLSPAKLKSFSRGAVCGDSPPCAQIARDTLALKDSTVIDAAVAGVLCNAVYGFHTSGLGGGFVLTYYKREERRVYVLNAREISPLNVTAEFCDAGSEGQCRKGAKAAGTPGTLLGLHTLWKRWGRLPWNSLVRPAILMCTGGFNMTAHMYHAAVKNREALMQDEYMRESLFNPDAHTVKLTGSWIKPPSKLCDTLKLIAQKEVFEFYEGVVGDDYALDVKEMGGVLDRNDLRKYRVAWNDASATQLTTGHTLYAAPAPHSGDLLVFTMNVLNGIAMQLQTKNENSTQLALHRMLEAFKYAEAFRNELGDPLSYNITQVLDNLKSRAFADKIRLNISDEYVVPNYTELLQLSTGSQETNHVTRKEQDGGYSHLSLISEGDAVSVTASLGSYFGAKVTSRRTGILLNSALGDFSFPSGSTKATSGPNLAGPGKRPLSPAAPAIVLNAMGEAQLVLGAAGGDRTTGALAQVIRLHILLNEGLKPAVDNARIYARLNPVDVLYEYGILKKHVQDLYKQGHVTSRMEGKYSTGICAIARDSHNRIEAIGDWRYDGESYGV